MIFIAAFLIGLVSLDFYSISNLEKSKQSLQNKLAQNQRNKSTESAVDSKNSVQNSDSKQSTQTKYGPNTTTNSRPTQGSQPQSQGVDCAALSIELTKNMYNGATVDYQIYVSTRNSMLDGVPPEQASVAQGSAIQQAYNTYLDNLKSGLVSSNRELNSAGCVANLVAPLPGSMY